MSSEADQSLLQIHEKGHQLELRCEMQHGIPNLKINHLKSIEILKYAVKIITSNTKFTLFMVFSLLPLYIFMVFYDIKIPEINDDISKLLTPPSFTYTYDYNGDEFIHDLNDPIRNRLPILLDLFPLYLFLLPLLELFSSLIIIKIAAKIYANESETIIEPFYQNNSLKSPFITSVLVQLLSTCTLAGLFWTVLSHHFIVVYFFLMEYNVVILSIGFHVLIFVAILYKYLEWSAYWNTGIVISVLQKEAGAYALAMSGYYGKYCKRTGFELMLIFFVYGFVLRLPFLVSRMFDYDVVEVVVAGIVHWFFCLGSLVKWVAFVVYYYDCKAQVLSKKVDEEVGKAMEDGDDFVHSEF